MAATPAHLTQFGAIKTLELIAALLPRPLGLRAGAGLGSLLYRCGFLRPIVDANLDWTHTETGCGRESLVHNLYCNLGRYTADFLQPHHRQLPFDNDHRELLNELFARKRGILVVLAHLGNWEAIAAIFGRRIPGSHAVAQQMNNPLTQRWLAKRRARTGITEINKHNALRPVIRCLRANQMVGLLIDQHPGKHGSPAPFLGQRAATVRSVAGLVRSTGAPVLLACALLKPDRSYHIRAEAGRVLDLCPNDDADGFIEAYQEEHNNVLSRWIREFPEHYFGWFHKRFKGELRYPDSSSRRRSGSY